MFLAYSAANFGSLENQSVHDPFIRFSELLENAEYITY